MSKPLLGLILGAIFGALDGATALFYPDTAPLITGILIGSTVKGLIAGVIIGFFARKVSSMWLGVLFGFGVSLLLAFLVAMQPTDGVYYYLEIMIPGSIVGIILGFATQKYGTSGKLA